MWQCRPENALSRYYGKADIIWHHVISHDVIWYHMMSHDSTFDGVWTRSAALWSADKLGQLLYNLISYDIIWHHMIYILGRRCDLSCRPRFAMWNLMSSCDITWHHMTSHNKNIWIISYDIMWYTIYHMISYDIMEWFNIPSKTQKCCIIWYNMIQLYNIISQAICRCAPIIHRHPTSQASGAGRRRALTAWRNRRRRQSRRHQSRTRSWGAGKREGEHARARSVAWVQIGPIWRAYLKGPLGVNSKLVSLQPLLLTVWETLAS